MPGERWTKCSRYNSPRKLRNVAEKATTAPKGRPTPKRVRRPAMTAPPANNKEARKRMRQQLKAERAERHEGAQRGDDTYLPKRDQGPVRQIVRNIVDARRNVGPWFFIGTFVVVLGSTQFVPAPVRSGASVLWLCLIVPMVADVILLTRRVKRIVSERFEGSSEHTVWLYGYAIMRSVVFRRWRQPAPAVELGDPIC